MIKKYKKIIAGIISVFTLAVLAVSVNGATEVVSAKAVLETKDTISQSEPVDGPFFGAGSTVHVTEKINGDVYAAGQTISITGDVSGDVIAFGQTINISGKVAGDVRVAGQTVTISSEVTGSVSAAAQTLSIMNDAKIGRDLAFASESANIDGQIERDVHAVSEKIMLSGKVGRDFGYMSEKKAIQTSSATVGGEVVQSTPEKEHQSTPASTAKNFLAILLSVAVTVIALTILFPRWVKTATARALPNPGKVLIAGLATLLVPIVMILLAVSVVGLYASLVVLLAYLLLLALGLIFVSSFIGRLIFADKLNVTLSSLLGLVIYLALLHIPIINLLVWAIGSAIGTGIVALDLSKRVSTKPVGKSLSELKKKRS